jgi:hypothetical protein
MLIKNKQFGPFFESWCLCGEVFFPQPARIAFLIPINPIAERSVGLVSDAGLTRTHYGHPYPESQLTLTLMSKSRNGSA